LTPSNQLDCVCVARDQTTGPVAVFSVRDQPPLRSPLQPWSFQDAVDMSRQPVLSTADVALLAGPGYTSVLITADGRQVSVWTVGYSGLLHMADLPETADPVVAIGAVHSTPGSKPVGVALDGGAIEIVASCRPSGRAAISP
jgi:hypothetical protein